MSRFTLPSERSEALLYSKHLVSAAALLLSMVACSSATPTGDDAGAGGTGAGGTGASGAALATGGSGGSLGGSSAGTSSAGGSGAGSGLTGGAGGTSAGGSVSFGGIPGAGGTSAAGRSGTGGGSGAGMGGTSAAAGAPSTGTGGVGSGTGGGTAAKCDNLSLAPSKTGVAAPTGAAGGLKVLDWAGFTGAVSFTFDDNTPSQLPDYNQLKATGAHFTWFVVGSWLSGNASTISGYKATIADGQELANHTYSHQSAGSESDLSKNESFIMTNLGVNANSMAAPNCDQSWSSVAPNVLFQNRGPCGNSAAAVSPRDSTSPFLLPAYLPNTGASAATLQGTFQTGKWRIFVIHGFDSQNGTYQPVPIDSVTTAMTAAVSGGYWTEGISNVGAYWQGQKLISASATTSATWTLPAHFPKNTCVRITTTGGTVTQSGKTIPWDPHGYYQISLDAGSVTVQ
ncbi:MAG: polysaccharide deacetylase family protein [Polyangiaceae bacterium]